MRAANEPPTIWIGGAPGAGKSTLGRAIAHAADLPLHPIDRWTYVHAAQQPPGPPLDEVLARGAEAAADAFFESARLRLGLVLDDVRGRDLGDVPALVEGPQLLPDLAIGLPAGNAVWLVPDSEQTRRAREQRLVGVHDPAARNRLTVLLQRDAVMAERIRTAATAAGGTVIELGPEPDWTAVRSAIESVLAPALSRAPRLAAGAPLAAQRRFENTAAGINLISGLQPNRSLRTRSSPTHVNAVAAAAHVHAPGRPWSTTHGQPSDRSSPSLTESVEKDLVMRARHSMIMSASRRRPGSDSAASRRIRFMIVVTTGLERRRGRLRRALSRHGSRL